MSPWIETYCNTTADRASTENIMNQNIERNKMSLKDIIEANFHNMQEELKLLEVLERLKLEDLKYRQYLAKHISNVTNRKYDTLRRKSKSELLEIYKILNPSFNEKIMDDIVKEAVNSEIFKKRLIIYKKYEKINRQDRSAFK